MKTHGAMLALAVLAGTVGVLGGENRISAADHKSTPVMVQDFEKTAPQPSVWVVGIPNENASVQFSSEHPYSGRQCLKLHYHFTLSGQYLGVPIPVKIQAPIHKLRFMLYGDGSGCGYGVYVADASDETHKYRNAETMKVDFKG